MDPKAIQMARHRLGLNCQNFGRLFNVSGRAVEKWEQGRTAPNRWIEEKVLEVVERRIKPQTVLGTSQPLKTLLMEDI